MWVVDVGVKFTNNSIKVKTALKEAGVAWLHEACGEIEAQTKRNSKVLTGKTKGSYQYRVDEDSLEGVVGSDSQNAIWEEFGTGEYAINGDGRKGGWFYKDERGNGHFTHGKKAKRPMFRAYTALKAQLQKMAQEKFGGLS
nr:MAG TPA: putative tail-component [Caudoviricetes sp.]